MKALGVRWVRYDVQWDVIQAGGPNSYNWTEYDRIAGAIQARGLNSLMILDYTPSWARRADCTYSMMCAPGDAGAYGRFAGAAAAHYLGYGVHTWEIWNEPNNLNYFKPAADPAEYTQLLKSAFLAVKGVDSNSTVLTGGTAPADTGSGYYSPPDFISGIYSAGGRQYFDAVAHHPYSWPYIPGFYVPGNAWDQITSIHNIMSANGDGAKKLWLTEYGAPTGGPGDIASNGSTYSEGGDDHVTESLEASMATQSVGVASTYPWIGGFFWYSYQDAGTSSDSVENFFGLKRSDGSRKPAYGAYQTAIITH